VPADSACGTEQWTGKNQLATWEAMWCFVGIEDGGRWVKGEGVVVFRGEFAP
jgi:hypothetical protein